MFGDKFETVFNERRTTEEIDQICDTLFEGNGECYVEKEHEQDGVLIYEPPPLDEMWLSEPEKRDRLNSLLRDRGALLKEDRSCSLKRCAKLRLMEKDHNVAIPHPIVKSDVEPDSDCDSQPDLNADFEAGGDDEVMDKDLWKDHPVQQHHP